MAGSRDEVSVDALWRILADRAPYGVFVTDRDGVVVYANERACTQLDRAEADIVGARGADFVAGDAGLGGAGDRDAELLRADGDTVPVRLRSLPTFDERTAVFALEGDSAAAAALSDAKERERALRRTLHSGLAQTLTALGLLVADLKSTIAEGSADLSEIENIEETLGGAVLQAREILYGRGSISSQ